MLVAAASVALVGASLGVGVYYGAGDGRILAGVHLADTDLGRLSVPQASALLERFGKEFQEERITLKTADKNWEFTFGELGARLDTKKIITTAFEVGRRGSFPERLIQVWRASRHGMALREPIVLSERRLRQVVGQIARERNTPALNARIDLETGIQYPERSGLEVDIDGTAARIQAAVAARRPGIVRILERRVLPRTTLANLHQIGAVELLSTYSTLVGPESDHRTRNMMLAVRALDGAIIRPGEVFSFNATTGPKTPARGYLPAPEIADDRMVTGTGGGVCQVSSTLYNAALLAGMEVVERRAHSQFLDYIPLGRDATVYDGLIDLKLRNARAHPVVLSAQIKQSRLTVGVLGHKEDLPFPQVVVGQVEAVEPGVQNKFDPALPMGQRVIETNPKQGYRVNVYRVFFKDGVEVGRELLSRDYYRAQDEVIRVGIGGNITQRAPEGR